MSHRRRRAGEKRQRKAEKVRHSHRKRHAAVAVALALVVLVGVLVATTPRPREFYVRCFESNETVTYHIHFWLYVQLGEREPGSLASDFIRIPENLGASSGCMWALHTHGDTPEERTNYYVKIHVESPYRFSYSLGDFFHVWGKELGYPAPVYFAADGASYYRGSTELLIHRGPTVDPFWNVYSSTARSSAYGSYVPNDGDYVEVIVHEPYETLPLAY